MYSFDENKADKGTVIRTVALVVTWANMVLVNYGLQPLPVLDDATIALILAGLSTAVAWFKNNYLTLTGKKQKKVLKDRGLTKAK